MWNKKLVIFATIFLMIAALVSPILVGGNQQIENAQTAWNTKDYVTASDSYAYAAQLLPWRKDLWEKAGIAAFASGDTSKAIDFLKRTSSLSEQGWATLGYAYFTQGDISTAIQTYQGGLQVYHSADLYQYLALAYRTQKDPQAERKALESQLELNGMDAFAHYRLGLLLSFLEPDKALSELTSASSLDPQYDSAVQTLRVALSDSSSDSDHLMKIGRALGLVQEWELALAAFQHAIELDNKNAEGWAWLGEAKQQTGGDGREELDRAIALDPASSTIHGLRGLYWSRQQKYESMLKEYVTAAQDDSQNPAWQASIGEAYIKLGDLASAFDAYQRATELAPNDSTYWRLLAFFCAENGVRVEDVGLPAAQKAVDLSPNDPLALDSLGFAYFSSGRFSNAEQLFLKVIDLAPAYLPARIHLAMNYLAQGNRTAALTSLTYVRDADKNGPDGKLAQQLLAQYFP